MLLFKLFISYLLNILDINVIVLFNSIRCCSAKMCSPVGVVFSFLCFAKKLTTCFSKFFMQLSKAVTKPGKDHSLAKISSTFVNHSNFMLLFWISLFLEVWPSSRFLPRPAKYFLKSILDRFYLMRQKFSIIFIEY